MFWQLPQYSWYYFHCFWIEKNFMILFVTNSRVVKVWIRSNSEWCRWEMMLKWICMQGWFCKWQINCGPTIFYIFWYDALFSSSMLQVDLKTLFRSQRFSLMFLLTINLFLKGVFLRWVLTLVNHSFYTDAKCR